MLSGNGEHRGKSAIKDAYVFFLFYICMVTHQAICMKHGMKCDFPYQFQRSLALKWNIWDRRQVCNTVGFNTKTYDFLFSPNVNNKSLSLRSQTCKYQPICINNIKLRATSARLFNLLTSFSTCRREGWMWSRWGKMSRGTWGQKRNSPGKI